MNLPVKALKIQNPISEKDVYYIIIGEGEKKVVINTGDKNYSKVEELLNPKQPELPLKNKEQKQQ